MQEETAGDAKEDSANSKRWRFSAARKEKERGGKEETSLRHRRGNLTARKEGTRPYLETMEETLLATKAQAFGSRARARGRRNEGEGERGGTRQAIQKDISNERGGGGKHLYGGSNSK